MLFSMICTDRPNSGELRAGTRDKHIAYLQSMDDIIVFAGPMTTDDGGAVVGSHFVIAAADQAAVEAFAAGDPYAGVDLFQATDIHPLRKVVWNPDRIDN